jgi:ubiquinone/menaquinone biosynthesis C-methylase UbiE
MSMFRDAYEQFETYVPADHARQVTSYYYASKACESAAPATVVDLGCGEGASYEYFRTRLPHVNWVGLDILSSPEVTARARLNRPFVAYDGEHIPLESNAVDLVFSNQVLEHVRQPAQLFAEVERVLRPGGTFIGSTSHLEPYHSYSFWNYTPHGLATLADAAGLLLHEVRPGIDAITLIVRKGVQWRWLNRFFGRESPLNRLIGVAGRVSGKSTAEINLIKLHEKTPRSSVSVQRRAQRGAIDFNVHLVEAFAPSAARFPRCVADSQAEAPNRVLHG